MRKSNGKEVRKGEEKCKRQGQNGVVSVLVHAYVHRCEVEGRAERGVRARCADTLIGHQQTMYSACFIFSRFINVNIFRPETTLLSPLLLILLARFPGGEEQVRLIDCSNPLRCSSFPFVATILYFLVILPLPSHLHPHPLPFPPSFLDSIPPSPFPSRLLGLFIPQFLSPRESLPSSSREILSG